MTVSLTATHSRRTVDRVTPRGLGYMPALDGLRAVAIVLVVFFHAVPAFQFGLVGVDVFFVLSGFLITTLIAEQIQSGGFSRRRFYARRAVRLVPALLVTVVVITPLGMLTMNDDPTLLGAIGALLYITPLMAPSIFNHTWTLAMEEWFYLLWPVVLGKLFRDRLTMRQAAVLAGSAGVLVQCGSMINENSLIVRPSALLIGSALGLWWLDGGRFRRPEVAVSAGLGLILLHPVMNVALWSPLPFWFAITGTVLVVGGLASGASGVAMRVLAVGPLVGIGVVSYEWYLIHAPMLRIAEEVWGRDSYWIVAPVSLATAFALHYALVPLQVRLRARLARTHENARPPRRAGDSRGVGALAGVED